MPEKTSDQLRRLEVIATRVEWKLDQLLEALNADDDEHPRELPEGPQGDLGSNEQTTR